jgi:hypothetical protein
MRHLRGVPGMVLASSMSLLTFYCAMSAMARAAAKLEPLPAGVMLPVSLEQRLDAGHVRVGEPIAARLMQRVPLADGSYLSPKARVMGTVVAYDGSSLTLRFERLRLGREQQPLHVKLLAAGHWFEVGQTKVPLEAADRALSNPWDWTTKQIGGDEVYRSGGSGAVYDRYSEPVGHADAYGVYAPSQTAGAPAQTAGAPALAMGPFSTTAHGVYGLPETEIASPGGAESPIVLRLTSPKWQLHGGTALLLQTAGNP